MKIRNYSKIKETVEFPNLVQMQTKSYAAFLQENVPAEKRKKHGLEVILQETFPINNYDETVSLEYIKYELGKPRYTPDECRQLKLIYGRPLRVWLRLNKEEPIEEEVYLGEVPVMIGGGEFVINGTERVIVSQLHRSPGVDFVEDLHGEKRMHSCRIIPERGSWIEIEVGKKDILTTRVDQSGKFPATSFLRAMSEDFSRDEDIIRLFYETQTVKVGDYATASKLKDEYVVCDLVNQETGEVILESGKQINDDTIKSMSDLNLESIEIIKNMGDSLILNSLEFDYTESHEDALIRIYSKFRPGNPQKLEKAKQLFHDKFFDSKRYRLGTVGRFRLNRKLGQDVSINEMTIHIKDYINAIKYIIKLRKDEGNVDDIDHLGNRRLRTIDELFGEELRKGFLKLRRTVQERMNVKDHDQLTPRLLINSRTIFSAIEYFFSRGELSQVLDQTNPLAQLTHERRLSALGPGGLNRKRAGFEVRDVHLSHYGRICPIETPEGTNIGLIASLSIYAAVDDYGFLRTPYFKVDKGKLTNEIVHLRADEEEGKALAPADSLPAFEKGGEKEILARFDGDFRLVNLKDVDYVDVSPKQLVGVSTSLIPFLEHSDANRALMGSNMQRQAVPLLKSEPPLVATGMEKVVARNSSMVVCAKNSGVVTDVTAEKIVIDDSDVYNLRKFVGLNEGTCLNQKPIVVEGQKIKRNEVIADGPSTCNGELSLGKNVLVAFMTWDGYNFEDAIVISERLLKDDCYTSIHRNELEVEVRETTLGKEEFTRDIPNVSEKALSNLDENGIIRIGTKVKPSDILVGKIAPKNRSELSPEEKLLHAIFGRAGEDVKNVSLEVPSGVEGIVINTQMFSRRAYLSDEKKQKITNEIKKIEESFDKAISKEFLKMIKGLEEIFDGVLVGLETNQPLKISSDLDAKQILDLQEQFDIKDYVSVKNKRKHEKSEIVCEEYGNKIETLKDEKNLKINQLKRGDELPSGVLEVAKISIATKRRLSVGDKMAGRHGNKGVIAKILPEENMPYLEDGTPVDMVLNPLGVPSRMNVGQILETHLGWAAKKLGFQAVTPIFDGATELEIVDTLKEAGFSEDGKSVLLDGRTGEPFQQRVTVGYMYMLKLHHLVDEKVHARATGPYSLITQQPLGGKARFGGQRFGEMEVWALEAYGAAYNLQELLTVKSDDVEGRTRIYESMVKGRNTLEAGTPASFDVLAKEIEGLGLSLKLEKESD